MIFRLHVVQHVSTIWTASVQPVRKCEAFSLRLSVFISNIYLRHINSCIRNIHCSQTSFTETPCSSGGHAMSSSCLSIGRACACGTTSLDSTDIIHNRTVKQSLRMVSCGAAPRNRSKSGDNTKKKQVLRKNPAIYQSPSPKVDTEVSLNTQRVLKKPEVLAPAGGWPQLMSAVENGADAVYFGVTEFNARARAENFGVEELPDVVKYIHERGVKGYLVLNVLVFDDEIIKLVETAQKAREAGVDAVIVQDLGAVELIKRGAPGLEIHGSTQMTVTSSEGLEYAASLGIGRVVVGRELSLKEITEISNDIASREAYVEIEAFVHGAMCVSYSGQCFSSEAWGGRSANRGQCAQACRLPYGLIVDGELKNFAEKYVLSPQDLAAVDLVPELIQAGVVSLKIEGRLKGPEYVALTTQVYRRAVDAAWDALQRDKQISKEDLIDENTWNEMRVTFARAQDEEHGGLTHGFLDGPKHQMLVRGRNPRHRGIYVGQIVDINSKRRSIVIEANARLKRGDGLVIDQGTPERNEIGGSIFSLKNRKGQDIEEAVVGDIVDVILGPSYVDVGAIRKGDLVFKNKDPSLMSRLKSSYDSVASSSRRRIPLSVSISCKIGQPLSVTIEDMAGKHVMSTTESFVQPATKRPVTTADLKKAIGINLGDDGSYTVGSFSVDFQGDENIFISMKEVKEARRHAMQSFLERSSAHQVSSEAPDPRKLIDNLMNDISRKKMNLKNATMNQKQVEPRIRVLCRTPEQVDAAIKVDWLEEIILDFLEVKGLQKSCEKVHNARKKVIVATPRIMKPDERYLWMYYLKLSADALLIRGTGMLHHFMKLGGPGTIIEEAENHPIPQLEGDFSLNATNTITADLLLDSGLRSLALTYDCNSDQMNGILAGLGERSQQIEIICHTNIPIFHTEHCIFARFLSEGNSYIDCGRPCESHTIHVRDPATGRDHLVEADMGCRNTVFEGSSQTAVRYMDDFTANHVGIYRVELVDQPSHIVPDILEGYRKVIQSASNSSEFYEWMQAIPDANGRCHGTTSGSLEVKKEQAKDTMKKTAASLRDA